MTKKKPQLKITIPTAQYSSKPSIPAELTQQNDHEHSTSLAAEKIESKARTFPLRDATGELIAKIFEPLSDEELAARIIQRGLRQISRARYLHQKNSLFGSNAKNTFENRINQNQIPPELQPILSIPLPFIFPDSIYHHSPYLEQILNSGRIYSSQALNTLSPTSANDLQTTGDPIKGLSCSTDKQRLDSRMAFTTVFCRYSSYFLKLKTSQLIQTHNSGKGVYFKFYDWPLATSYHYPITPEILIHFSFTRKLRNPSTVYFIRQDHNQILAEIPMANEEFIYQGFAGLNRYITLFIFKILDQLSSSESDLRLKQLIIDHFVKLQNTGKLIEHLQSMMRAILKTCELDFVHSLTLSFSSLSSLTLGKTTYCLQTLRRHIQFDDLSAVQQFLVDNPFKSSYFLAKSFLDFALQHKASRVADFIREEFNGILTASADYLELIHRTELVYNQYLSVAYKQTHLYLIDNELTIDGQIVYRPNHGLAHTVRVVSYIEWVINYFKQFALDEGFRVFCTHLEDRVLDLQTVLLFSTVGRESDLSFQDNPEVYQSYRLASANAFEAFAINYGYSQEKINQYKELVLYMGNPDYLNTYNTFGKPNEWMFHLINLAHKLDLMRCYSKNQYEKSLHTTLSQITLSSPEQTAALTRLYLLVTLSIKATGDRLCCQYLMGMCNQWQNYQKDVFLKSSTNPDACMALVYDLTAKIQIQSKLDSWLSTATLSKFCHFKPNKIEKIKIGNIDVWKNHDAEPQI